MTKPKSKPKAGSRTGCAVLLGFPNHFIETLCVLVRGTQNLPERSLPIVAARRAFYCLREMRRAEACGIYSSMRHAMVMWHGRFRMVGFG
jgi:hypothetical protein